jgi:hypothetical protein
MNAPLVSIVMSAYNASAYLAESIESIKVQDFQDWEFVIVDDGSTDSTPSILGSLEDPRIKVIRNPTNRGLTYSLNRGLRHTRGCLIARQDADDRSLPDRLSLQVEFLSENNDFVLVGSDYEMINKDGKVVETIHLPYEHQDLIARLETGNVFCHGSVMFKAAPVRSLGLYREKFPVTQDYDLWLRIGERYRIGNLKRVLYQFRFDGSSISRSNRALQLAYRRYAHALHVQRQETGEEQVVNGDVMQVFPPDPGLLLRDARGVAYLHYASGDQEKAEEALIKARDLAADTSWEPENWHTWLLGRATHLSDLQGDVHAGAEFMRWACNVLMPPLQPGDMDQLIGGYYADRTFSALARTFPLTGVNLAVRAALHDPVWLSNKGLWIQALRTIIPGVHQAL